MNRRELIISGLALMVPQPIRAQSSRNAIGSILEKFVDELLRTMPQTLTVLGRDKGMDGGARSILNDRSAQGSARLRAILVGLREQLSSLTDDEKRGPQQIDYNTAAYLAETSLQSFNFPFGDPGIGGATPYLISQLSGAYRTIPSFLGTQHPMETCADAEAYLSRLNAFGQQLDQETERSRAHYANGAAPPTFIIGTTLEQLRALVSTSPEQNPLVLALVQRSKICQLKGRWRERAVDVVTQEVYPAIRRQVAFLEGAMSNASSEAGVWRLPRGDEYYRYAVRAFTTTDTVGDDIYALGHELVAEYSGQADTLLRSLGLSRGSVGSRTALLRSRPDQLYADNDKSRAELLAYLKAINGKIETKLPRYFGELPRAKLDIVRMSTAIEAGAPSATYQPPSLDGTRPGLFSMNLRNLAEWPRFELATLVFHEGIPGHHLQNALMIEAKNIPTLRRLPLFSGYIEGWGMYAEQLAEEMGAYEDDPLARVGYLSSMLLRATRLVVDSGLHHKRWSRAQAITYMTEVLGIPLSMARREVERYCVQPAQASSYMLGWRVWTEARAAAKARHGRRFDLKRFHDQGLLAGNMPLEVLSKHLAEY